MSKVIKSFSLDRRTVDMLEYYVNDSVDAGLMSRSKVVNDSIVWFLSDQARVAELVHSNESLQERFREAMIEKHSTSPKKAWWKAILGLR